LSKIMEKAILERIKSQFPHLIASKYTKLALKKASPLPSMPVAYLTKSTE
jgi:hypothetical protein